MGVVSQFSEKTAMAIKTYQYQAKTLVDNYVLADPFIPYTSILGGILLCKILYDLTHLVSSWYYKGYPCLTKMQRMEWSNRGISTGHALFISAIAVYLVFFSDLYNDSVTHNLIVEQHSSFSTFALGVSVGYFISDLAMILWLYPCLGGREYIVHHSFSVIAVAYSMLSGEGQLYTYMVLLSELTTPCVNLRWYLDTAGLKSSPLYILNGILMFLGWMVARIALFGLIYYHVYKHFDQVKQMFPVGLCLVFVVPTALVVMNLMWFGKILKGLKKTIARRK